MKKIIRAIFFVFVIVPVAIFFAKCYFSKKDTTVPTRAIWWWTSVDCDVKYLEFLGINHINEIYLGIGFLGDGNDEDKTEKVKNFIAAANEKGITVSALCGEWQWIQPDNDGFDKAVALFNDYQNSATENQKFYGLHLDIEPHQSENWDTNKDELMQLFCDFIVAKIAPLNIVIEMDIPFWLENFTVVCGGESLPMNEVVFKYADTVVIMSYRDTAEKTLEICTDEIALAKKYDKKIVLGQETFSTEGDQVSYYEEGFTVMNLEINILEQKLLKEFPNKKFGIAIHDMKRFYEMS
ncbi:MAG: hypothetical protein LBQ05_02270 [Christensenellaceae bacterium]|jgi:hypothetical protein|nr:hypothetical protein [Christensenellaceae bacterium]